MIRVLIVDDTKSVHAFVKALISKSKDVQSVSVFDGLQAVELLAKDRSFDLILLDWEMPNLTGPETFAKFLEMGINHGVIPTIMMTTKNSPDDIAKMLGMGVAEYMMKPFTIDIFFEKLEAVCGKSLTYAA